MSTNPRDRRIADDVAIDRALLCCANDCPNRWSVDAGAGRCCSAHAWADHHLWPQITAEQQDAETDRALANTVGPAPSAPRVPLTLADKREILGRLAALFRKPRDHRAWQRALEEKVRRGEQLSAMQRHCLAEARRSMPATIEDAA